MSMAMTVEIVVFSSKKQPALPVVLDGSKVSGVVLIKLCRRNHTSAAQLSDNEVAAGISAWIKLRRV